MRRMIDSAMWEDKKFTKLPLGAQLLRIAMINHADDLGVVGAHPALLLKTAFPYNEEISTSNIREWLTLLADSDFIELYKDNGRSLSRIVNWDNDQFIVADYGKEWPRLRAGALRRDGHQCQKCGSRQHLHAHHNLPLTQGGKNELENLTVFCRPCHREVHRQMRADAGAGYRKKRNYIYLND